MDPLLTNRIDPALLRILDKRGTERDNTPRRRRPPSPDQPKQLDEESAEPTQHELDDLA